MDRFRIELHRPSVAEVKIVPRWHPLHRLFDQSDQPRILGNRRNGRLRIRQRRQFLGNELLGTEIGGCDAHGASTDWPNGFSFPNYSRTRIAR